MPTAEVSSPTVTREPAAPELFEHLAHTGHEQVLICSNPEAGLRAIIAVHSSVLGPALGGVRMWPFKSFDEALADVLRLSRGMTYKAAAAGLNLGGGKAVILGDPKQDKSEALMRAFGCFIQSLGGLYITAEDVGTSMPDMDLIYNETRWVTGLSPSLGGSGDPSPVTAWGTFQGIKAAAEWRFGNASLAKRAVAVQGLGSVGFHLAKYLRDEGAAVIGCDLDPERTDRAAAELGVEVVPPEAIFDADADVFAPCALGGSLNDETIPRLRVSIVAGAANNQLADEALHGRELERRGILYAPDFVINAGGLINVYNELTGGYHRERALHMTRRIYENLLRVFEIARTESITTHRAAERLAEQRIERIQRLRPQRWGRLIERRN